MVTVRHYYSAEMEIEYYILRGTEQRHSFVTNLRKELVLKKALKLVLLAFKCYLARLKDLGDANEDALIHRPTALEYLNQN